jgi:N-acetylmuramoyl-L-alanine amidase
MFPIYRSIKQRKTPTRSALLCGIACVSLFLGACDITGSAYKNGPIPPPSSNDEKMADEVSRMESTAPAPSPAPRVQSSNLNPKNLFAKNLRSDSDRLDRLERALQDLRNEFDSVKPSVRRLMAIEADIQNLVGELRRLSEEPELAANNSPARQRAPASQPQVMRPAPVITPKAAKPKPSVQRKAPPPVSEGTTVYDVRIGEHPGKTRIVLDTNAKASFSVDVDNDEKIMVIDLPNAGWSAAMSKNLSSKTLRSYRVEESGNGNLLIFQLKKSVEIASQEEIPGTGGAGRRIVIDLR